MIVEPLFSRSGCVLSETRCVNPAAGEQPGVVAEYEVVLPVAGRYLRRLGGRTHVGDATRVLLANPNDAYTAAHPDAHGDVCTCITLDNSAIEALARTDTLAPGRAAPRFRAHSIPASGALYLAHRRLRHALRAAAPDALAVDELMHQVLLEAAAASSGSSGNELDTRRRHTDRSRRTAVQRVIEYIHERMASPLRLEELARVAAYSRFHLIGVFRDEVGLSIHRYIVQLRLRSAFEEVLDTRADLTSIALASGFSSHSHFTSAFAREFGATPSRVRATWKARTVAGIAPSRDAPARSNWFRSGLNAEAD